MLMAVNIGNSRISFGFFGESAEDLRLKFQISTDINKTSDEYLVLIRALGSEMLADQSASGVILSSVVPQLTETVCDALRVFSGKEPLLVGPGVKTGFPIKIDSPSELGGDMVANTAAVLHILKEEGRRQVPAVIADVGTVTTVSAVSRSGEYIGCAIFAGVRTSLDLLHGETAQLPNVMLSAPTKVLGKNSQDAVRAGVILGTAMALDGFVGRIAKEMKIKAEELALFVTGEYANAVKEGCRYRFSYDGDLTLKGLYFLYQNTVE